MTTKIVRTLITTVICGVNAGIDRTVRMTGLNPATHQARGREAGGQPPTDPSESQRGSPVTIVPVKFIPPAVEHTLPATSHTIRRMGYVDVVVSLNGPPDTRVRPPV